MCDYEEFRFECGDSDVRLKSHCHFARNDPNHQCFSVKVLRKTWLQENQICDKCTGKGLVFIRDRYGGKFVIPREQARQWIPSLPEENQPNSYFLNFAPTTSIRIKVSPSPKKPIERDIFLKLRHLKVSRTTKKNGLVWAIRTADAPGFWLQQGCMGGYTGLLLVFAVKSWLGCIVVFPTHNLKNCLKP